MCEEQVHFNNHILTALAQHTYFHNTSNKNKHTGMYNKAWKNLAVGW